MEQQISKARAGRIERIEKWMDKQSALNDKIDNFFAEVAKLPATPDLWERLAYKGFSQNTGVDNVNEVRAVFEQQRFGLRTTYTLVVTASGAVRLNHTTVRTGARTGNPLYCGLHQMLYVMGVYRSKLHDKKTAESIEFGISKSGLPFSEVMKAMNMLSDDLPLLLDALLDACRSVTATAA